jgi:GntR family transcriptional regulator, transcriptional repressor for pyruvate dehydrogenase complex
MSGPVQRRFTRIDKTPAYRLLADSLVREILEGRLRVGELLPTEGQLCAEFGVQRTTVREGIRSLEEAGMVRREGGKRLVVSRPSPHHVGGQIQRAMILHAVTYGELCEALVALEPAMARAAAARRDVRVVERLEHNVADTRRMLREGGDIAALDVEFHGILAEASGNRALTLAREPLQRLLEPSFRRILQSVPDAGARLLRAHAAILEALAAGDADRIEDWTRRHLEDFRRGFRVARIDLDQAVGAEAP